MVLIKYFTEHLHSAYKTLNRILIEININPSDLCTKYRSTVDIDQ